MYASEGGACQDRMRATERAYDYAKPRLDGRLPGGELVTEGEVGRAGSA